MPPDRWRGEAAAAPGRRIPRTCRGPARRHGQRRQLPQPHAGARRRRGARASRTCGAALAFARDERAEGLDGRRARTAWAARRSRAARSSLDMTRASTACRSTPSAEVAHRRERRHLARHPEAAPPAVRGARRCSRPTSSRSAARSRSTRTAWTTGRARSAARSASMRVMLPDGTVQHGQPRPRTPSSSASSSAATACSASILDVELEVTDNVVYRSERRVIDYQAFPTLFAGEIAPDPSVGLMYGHLSTVARVAAARDARSTPTAQVDAPRRDRAAARRGRPGEAAPAGLQPLQARADVPMRLKWFAEKHVEPRLESCTVTRNAGDGRRARRASSRATTRCTTRCRTCGTACPTRPTSCTSTSSRGERSCRSSTACGAAVGEEHANLLNASVRVVHREDDALSYAPADDMLAVVLYLNQPTDPERHRARWRG